MRIFLVAFFLYISHGIAYTQNITTLDGRSLGKRSDFIKSCAGATKDKLMKINGLEVNAINYCSCVCDNLIPTILSKDILEAMKEGRIKELFLEEKNFAVIMECLKGNFKVKDEFKFESIDSIEGARESAMKNCLKGALESEEAKSIWTSDLAEKYCDCAITKLFSSGYTYKDLNQAEDENSEVYKKIVKPCVEEILKKENGEEEQGSKK